MIDRREHPPSARPLASMPALATVLSTLVACGGEGVDAPWPQWRGPTGDGVSTEAPLPTTWSIDSYNVRWRTEIPGVGNSQPVVADGRVFGTYAYRQGADPFEPDPLESEIDPEAEAADETWNDDEEAPAPDQRPAGTERLKWRAVMAIDLESGNVLWTKPLFEAPAERKHRLNTIAAPTPATDGRHLYVYFGSVLAKLDLAGEVLWQHEIDPGYGRLTRYGAASSPVLTDEDVIVVQDKEWARTEDVGWMAAYSKETGEQRWRTEWEHTCCSYATPLVVDRGAGQEIVFAHSGEVTSYSAEDGERLWSVQVEILQMVSTPILARERADGDVLAVSGGAHNVKRTIFFRLEGAGRDTRAEQLWDDPRFAPQNSSPVLYGDRFFTVNDAGVLTSWDAATGEVVWNHRLSRGKNRASLIAGDGKLYVQSSSGVVTVVAVEDDGSPQILAENSLGDDGSNATPAVAGGCLLLRTARHLTCVEAEASEPPT
ncbi:MAG TPA: PQQ-binding-like beta-propeller repeat protein [Thermoanaerobaculia bacterium]|nr:PQQ-binding-like beta-propeller repeat protein [Thermoanaerobaculia bacterium]